MSGSSPPLPDLTAEDLPEKLVDDADLVEEVADPLLPPRTTAGGVDAVDQALAKARRVTFYPSGTDEFLVVSLSPKQAKLIVDRARHSA